METSSTVKLYLLKANILEEGSQEVKKAVEEADLLSSTPATIGFSSWDNDLLEAADREGLTIV